MSTKSILKNVNIRSRAQGNCLANALEHAEKFQGKDIVFSRSVSEIKGEEVKKFFGVEK